MSVSGKPVPHGFPWAENAAAARPWRLPSRKWWGQPSAMSRQPAATTNAGHLRPFVGALTSKWARLRSPMPP